MIIGTGIDIVKVERLTKLISEKKKSFSKKLFTQKEINYCEQGSNIKISAQHYAGRFAAKEAFLKALGTGWRNGIDWKDIEIVNDDYGKPCINLHQNAKDIIKKQNITNIQLSISHSNDDAVAMVVLEK